MDKREREAILRQGATRPEPPGVRREREALDEDLRGNPLGGAPLRQRLRNFRADADAQLAALGGPLAWMRRLRAIESAIHEHELRLAEAYAEAESPAAWRATAQRWDFGEVNELIRQHNEWFPIERRLAVDLRTRDYVKINGRSYRREELGPEWILEQFPLDPRRHG